MIKPEQLTAIIDNREQRPLNLAPLKVQRGTLQTGDYSLLGLEHVICVERKSLDDLTQCVGRDRERFEREIERILAFPCRALIVEAEWSDIEKHNYRSKVHPSAVMGSIMSWIARGLPVICIGTHERAGTTVSRLMFCAARQRYREFQPFIEMALAVPQSA